MAQRTITVDLDRASGKASITVFDSGNRSIGRVTVSEVYGPDQTRWAALGGDGLHYYGSLEMAFRNAMLSAVQVVTEDLLPTKSRGPR